MKNLVGCLESEPLARPVIQSVLDHSQLLVRHGFHAPFLWDVLAQQPIEVLVAAALPAAIRIGNPGQAEIELTWNWGTESYDIGTAYGHIAIAVPDAHAACDKIKAAGGNVTREADPVKGGTTVIAFVTDPDGCKIVLIQAKSTAYYDERHSGAKSTDPLRSA